MKIHTINSGKNIRFGDKILNKKNKSSIIEIKQKFEMLKQNGIPVGDCIYKIPEDTNVNLTTNDNKYTISENNFANNLLIMDNSRKDSGRYIINNDFNVNWYDDNQDRINIKKNSKEAKIANDNLTNILQTILNKCK